MAVALAAAVQVADQEAVQVADQEAAQEDQEDNQVDKTSASKLRGQSEVS